jgi:hypothetical protein
MEKDMMALGFAVIKNRFQTFEARKLLAQSK